MLVIKTFFFIKIYSLLTYFEKTLLNLNFTFFILIVFTLIILIQLIYFINFLKKNFPIY